MGALQHLSSVSDIKLESFMTKGIMNGSMNGFFYDFYSYFIKANVSVIITLHFVCFSCSQGQLEGSIPILALDESYSGLAVVVELEYCGASLTTYKRKVEKEKACAINRVEEAFAC